MKDKTVGIISNGLIKAKVEDIELQKHSEGMQ